MINPLLFCKCYKDTANQCCFLNDNLMAYFPRNITKQERGEYFYVKQINRMSANSVTHSNHDQTDKHFFSNTSCQLKRAHLHSYIMYMYSLPAAVNLLEV